MSTPHISAEIGDFAKTVLMPGDPLRSEFIAKTFLTLPRLVNDIRGVRGYTGEYKGKKVSVMASGMGMPSIGIYSYELYNYYGVDNIIRVGSAGALSDSLKLRDIIFAMGACTNSSFGSQYSLPGVFAPVADYGLLSAAVKCAEEEGIAPAVGSVLSSDTFYDDSGKLSEWRKMGVLAVEMECAALYMTASRFGKRALTICTVSDCPFTGEECTPEERQKTFTQMITIALNTAVSI
ncbi:MAG: purine-nucleoside phosphorylase [Oscillospiraceae bacterium]|nr:purine-nucleoside phosphorylase [Oscillospiraceae bacterium]